MSYQCQFCDRETKNAGANGKHQKHCKENPDRVDCIMSPKVNQTGKIPWNKGKKVPLTDYHKSIRLDDSEVFVSDSTYQRGHIKKRILDQSLIEYECKICGLGPEWQGKPMVLVLDHINGKNNDHRLENLRFVCSNCDSQLPTYKSKNKK